MQPAFEHDERLDFFSEQFDPLLALKSAAVALPDPRARPLDTVYKCRQFLPSDHPDAFSFARSQAKSPASELAKSRTSYLLQKKQREENRRNPLQEIMDAITSGPLLLLKQACAERNKVRVLTRHARGVRGTSTGTLVAFDKYMNLVMRDVEEDYTVLLKLERVDLGDGRLSRGRRKQERRHRSLKLVFVRGDSVVCVQRPAPAMSAGPLAENRGNY